MAERTIDIIYKFIADTKQFEEELRRTGGKGIANLKPPSYKELEAQLRGVKGELDRLTKLNRITKEDSKKIYDNYLQAANAVDKMTRSLQKMQYINKTAEMDKVLNPNFQRGPGGTFPWQAVGNRLTREEILMKKGRSGMESLETSEMATLFNTGSRVAEKMASRIKIARVELSRFNREAQVEGKRTRATLEEIGRAVMVKGFSFYGLRMTGASIAQQGQLASLIGGGISGGIFKAASEYIKKLESATPISREWAEQMQRVEKTQMRIGKILASESLPLLEKGADLLGKLAGYIERNPGQVGALLKGGLTLAGIGGLVIALGKGITLVADVAFIAATINMLKGGRDAIIMAGSFGGSVKAFGAHVNKYAVATATAGKLTIGKYAPITKLAPPVTTVPIGGATVAGAAGAGGFMAAVASFATAVGIFGAAVYLTDKAFDKILGEDAGLEDYVNTGKQYITLLVKGFGDFLSMTRGPLGKKFIPEDLGEQWFRKVRDALFKVDKESEGAADGLEGISDILANSLKRDEILKAWEDYQADDLKMVQDHENKRKEIIQKALDDVAQANAEFASDMRKIANDMGRALAKATADYNKQVEKDEKEYQDQRAEIIKEGGEEIRDIEADLQEKLRKLHDDYAERERELLNARDAVGLIKNRQKYLKERSEAEREANKEIAERRRDLAQRLQDLQVQHEQERAERFAEYQARLEEIRANAKQEMDELRAKHAEELREIQLNRNARLKELDTQHTAERERRRQAFLQQVRDLDATLLGEENLRKEYQARMLRDLDAFLARYRAGQNQLLQGSVGSKQFGGYTTQGLYKLHHGEYVINPRTTQTLEGLMGGQLSQAGLIQMAQNSRTQITWNDQRRFDSRLQASDRRAIKNDTLDVIQKVVR